MKQDEKHDVHRQEPKLQVVYTAKKELAAVHLITPEGIISYTSLGAEPGPSRQANQQAA